jgi:hypothetical protein
MRLFEQIAAGSVPAILLAFAPAAAKADPAALAHFPLEEQARKYCPDDTIVWVYPASGKYHLKGHAYYGVGRDGFYACRKEADAAGFQPPAKPQ